MRIKKILAAVPALICAAGMSITAFAEDRFPLDGDDDTLYEAEEASIYDDIREGYYICHISYHGGAPEIYAEDGSGYSLVGEIGGYIGGGETRESVEKEITESVRNDFVSIGVNPDDYAFDVYAYFYDDYDLTPEEFLNFVNEDIFRRDSERDTQTSEVPNPVTGTGLPIAAAALSALSVAGVLAVGRKKLS